MSILLMILQFLKKHWSWARYVLLGAFVTLVFLYMVHHLEQVGYKKATTDVAIKSATIQKEVINADKRAIASTPSDIDGTIERMLNGSF